MRNPNFEQMNGQRDAATKNVFFQTNCVLRRIAVALFHLVVESPKFYVGPIHSVGAISYHPSAKSVKFSTNLLHYDHGI